MSIIITGCTVIVWPVLKYEPRSAGGAQVFWWGNLTWAKQEWNTEAGAKLFAILKNITKGADASGIHSVATVYSWQQTCIYVVAWVSNCSCEILAVCNCMQCIMTAACRVLTSWAWLHTREIVCHSFSHDFSRTRHAILQYRSIVQAPRQSSVGRFIFREVQITSNSSQGKQFTPYKTLKPKSIRANNYRFLPVLLVSALRFERATRNASIINTST